MIVLAFDTAAEACSAAVWRDGETLARRSERLGRGHAERLFPMLEELLAEARLDWADLDRIGVVAGPGSFTGLRIGVAAARGLALALGRPSVALDGFEAIAISLASEQEIDRLAVCAGRPQRLQWRSYELRAGRARALGETHAGDLDALAADQPELLAGPAVDALADLDDPRFLVCADARSPDPTVLCRMTAEAAPPFEPPHPRYARDADAAPAKPAAPRLPT